MKFLLDFLPIVLFFISYKWGHANPEAAQTWVNALLGPMLGQTTLENSSTVGTQAAILLATAVAIVSTVAQIAIQKVLRRPIEAAQWLGLFLIVVFGGATLVLKNELFIKWKPTLLYAMMATGLAIAHLAFGINAIERMMQQHMHLPKTIWGRLLWLWVGFFISMAVLNALVVHYFSTETWVNFKLYGTLAATFIFVLGQGLYMARHTQNQTTTK